MQIDFAQKIIEFCRRHALFQAGDKIGLAVSGGVDSMSLLDVFDRIRMEAGIEIVVLHFNHHLRAEAEEEQQFIEHFCRDRSLPFISDGAQVGDYAQTSGMSIEMAAREKRYAFFEASGQRLSLTKIATGHTANDQAETVLDHIIRGSGPAGLAGIPVKRDIFIRPLLFAERSEIELYAANHDVPFREDASNRDQRYKRNRIRHTLLPMLREEFNPQIIDALCRLSAHVAETNSIVEIMADEAYNRCVEQAANDKIVLEFDEFMTYLNSLQRLVLRRVFQRLGQDPNLLNHNRFRNIKQFIDNGSSHFLKFADDIYIITSGGKLIIDTQPPVHHKVALSDGPGRHALWDNLFLEIKPSAKPLTLENQNKAVEHIDADKLQSPLAARSIQNGDIFFPLNGAGPKSVARFFKDAKIPFHERGDIPILESSGRIVWLCGHRLDNRFKVTQKTKIIYQLQITKREQ